MIHTGMTVYSCKVPVQTTCRLRFQVLKQLAIKLKKIFKEDVCYSFFFVVIWEPEELFLGVTSHRGKLGLQHINHLKAPRDS